MIQTDRGPQKEKENKDILSVSPGGAKSVRLSRPLSGGKLPATEQALDV